MKTFFTLLLATLVTQTTFARSWDRIEIPGAVCGDGLPYSVFVDPKPKSKNLLIEFMGGGACWDYNTCYGVNFDGIQFRTWMHPMPEVPFYSYMTTDMWLVSNHPFVKDSAIYLPYCTGDVFAADHKANYEGVSAYHQGYRNILMTLMYLNQKNIINFAQTERLTVWGASAGAIGAFVHLKNIEPYFPRAKKIAIIDSAGLHFGKDFWHKFTVQLFADYSKSFANIGLQLNFNDGFVAQNMGPVFATTKNWTIGIMQSTRDWVMSTVFGEITPEGHRSLVLSDRGIATVARRYPNTSVWITDSETHTFLLVPTTAGEQGMEKETAMNFINQIIDKSARTTIK